MILMWPVCGCVQIWENRSRAGTVTAVTLARLAERYTSLR